MDRIDLGTISRGQPCRQSIGLRAEFLSLHQSKGMGVVLLNLSLIRTDFHFGHGKFCSFHTMQKPEPIAGAVGRRGYFSAISASSSRP